MYGSLSCSSPPLHMIPIIQLPLLPSTSPLSLRFARILLKVAASFLWANQPCLDNYLNHLLYNKYHSFSVECCVKIIITCCTIVLSLLTRVLYSDCADCTGVSVQCLSMYWETSLSIPQQISLSLFKYSSLS